MRQPSPAHLRESHARRRTSAHSLPQAPGPAARGKRITPSEGEPQMITSRPDASAPGAAR